MELEFSRRVFEKFSEINFHENSSSGSRIVPSEQTDRQTDTTNLTVTFRNFANAVTFPAVTTTELIIEGTLSVPASRIHRMSQHYHRTTDDSHCLAKLDRLEVLTAVLLEYQRVTPCRWVLSALRSIVVPSPSWSNS
jgi:hypothetical protein